VNLLVAAVLGTLLALALDQCVALRGGLARRIRRRFGSPGYLVFWCVVLALMLAVAQGMIWLLGLTTGRTEVVAAGGATDVVFLVSAGAGALWLWRRRSRNCARCQGDARHDPAGVGRKG